MSRRSEWMTYTKAGPSRGRSTAQAATQSLFWSLCFRRGDAVGALRGGGDRMRAGDVGDLGSDAAVPDHVADGGGGDRQTTSSSLVSAGLLPAAAARRGGGGGVDGLRAVEDLAVQDSPGASAAPADRVGGGGDRQTTSSSSSSSSGAFMPTRATAARDDRRRSTFAGETGPGLPRGGDGPAERPARRRQQRRHQPGRRGPARPHSQKMRSWIPSLT